MEIRCRLLAMQLRTEIEIDAPPKLVWEVLTDRASYHEWNPFITTFEGPLSKGKRLNIVLSPPDSSDFRVRPRVLVVDPEKELRWRGKMLSEFLFSGEHYLTLTELERGRTRVCHGEDFGGLLLKFFAKQMNNAARGFVFMNQALKKRVEDRARSQRS
jgi:hypothetical protein